MQHQLISPDDLLWGRFFSQIHELAEQLRAKKAVEDSGRQAHESSTGNSGSAKLTTGMESTSAPGDSQNEE